MEVASADYGGGPHAAHGGNSLDGFQGPRQGKPDFEATLVTRKATVRLRSGKEITAWRFNGRIPGPELRVRQGDLVAVTLVNEDIDSGVSIHWHGVDVPNREDGVSGVTQDALRPGERYTYRFRAEQVGTFWYPTHQDAATGSGVASMGRS
jgi:FtsP/CotA-like multicopper oxidase with cupredoxin domain